MDVVVRVVMFSFMYEGSEPVMMLSFMLGLCIIMLEPFYSPWFLFAVYFWVCHWLFLPFWIFLITVALYWENE